MTELIWDGKYVDGKKQSPVRVALPFQTIETVNESAADRMRTMEMFASGRETEWRKQKRTKYDIMPKEAASF
jgi:adenine-specific DNA-methyltransferase